MHILPSVLSVDTQESVTDDDVMPLSGADCWRLLGRRGTGHLGVDDEGGTEFLPVSYLTHAGCLYVRSDSAASLPELTPWSRVTLACEGGSDSAHWTVAAHGQARRLISDQDISRSGVRGLRSRQESQEDDYAELRPDRVMGRLIRTRA